MTSSGFPAVAGPGARVLILGSLPGAVSLARGEYYAQPRNAFWPIMAELLDAAPTLDYSERVGLVVRERLAIWDVCARATRKGSLDAAIVAASVVPNDIAGFLRSHPGIRRICFNGTRAADLFRRFVVPRLPEEALAIRRLTLPSTSPAHAAMSFQQKLQLWRTGVNSADFRE